MRILTIAISTLLLVAFSNLGVTFFRAQKSHSSQGIVTFLKKIKKHGSTSVSYTPTITYTFEDKTRTLISSSKYSRADIKIGQTIGVIHNKDSSWQKIDSFRSLYLGTTSTIVICIFTLWILRHNTKKNKL